MELLLVVISIMGIYSVISTFTWYINAYKLMEEIRDRDWRDLPLTRYIKFKMFLSIMGALSMIGLFMRNPEAGKAVLAYSFVICMIWFIYSGRLLR